jgi:hypothetical protein
MCVVGVTDGRNIGRIVLVRIMRIKQIINIKVNLLVIYIFADLINLLKAEYIKIVLIYLLLLFYYWE